MDYTHLHNYLDDSWLLMQSPIGMSWVGTEMGSPLAWEQRFIWENISKQTPPALIRYELIDVNI